MKPMSPIVFTLGFTGLDVRAHEDLWRGGWAGGFMWVGHGFLRLKLFTWCEEWNR
jgi:hypothetical protein